MTRSVVLVLALAVLCVGPAGCGSLIVTQRSVKSLAGQSGFEWETHSVDGFDIFVEPETAAAVNLDAIAADAHKARRKVLAYLGEDAYEPTVSIFVVDSRDRMKDLIGRRSNALAYYTSNSLCLVWNNTLQVGASHELLHVVAMNRWGVPERWVNEGMAVDASGRWRGQDLHAICKVLHERGELPSLADMTGRFNRLPGLVSYPASGSFVRHLREEYGLTTVRMVWDGGSRSLPSATGLDLATLEAQWLATVQQADAEGVVYETQGSDG